MQQATQYLELLVHAYKRQRRFKDYLDECFIILSIHIFPIRVEANGSSVPRLSLTDAKLPLNILHPLSLSPLANITESEREHPERWKHNHGENQC